MPKKSKAQPAAKTPDSSPVRRTRAEIEAIMKRMSELVGSGSTITDALKHLGISYSNYDYWSKKMGFAIAGIGRRAAGRVARRGSAENVLQAMLDNRRNRSKLESGIKDLDSEYEALRRKLGR